MQVVIVSEEPLQRSTFLVHDVVKVMCYEVGEEGGKISCTQKDDERGKKNIEWTYNIWKLYVCGGAEERER